MIADIPTGSCPGQVPATYRLLSMANWGTSLNDYLGPNYLMPSDIKVTLGPLALAARFLVTSNAFYGFSCHPKSVSIHPISTSPTSIIRLGWKQRSCRMELATEAKTATFKPPQSKWYREKGKIITAFAINANILRESNHQAHTLEGQSTGRGEAIW